MLKANAAMPHLLVLFASVCSSSFASSLPNLVFDEFPCELCSAGCFQVDGRRKQMCGKKWNIWSPFRSVGKFTQFLFNISSWKFMLMPSIADHAGCLEALRSTRRLENIFVTHGHGMLVAMDAASSKRLLHGQEVKLAEVVVGFGACEINFSHCRCLGFDSPGFQQRGRT